MKFAVIKTGGKQYLVHENEEIVVDKLPSEKDGSVSFETLATGEDEKGTIEMGTPVLKKKVSAQLLENMKGDKIRVFRFKAKTRYRKTTGFRPHLSRVKIVSI